MAHRSGMTTGSHYVTDPTTDRQPIAERRQTRKYVRSFRIGVRHRNVNWRRRNGRWNSCYHWRCTGSTRNRCCGRWCCCWWSRWSQRRHCRVWRVGSILTAARAGTGAVAAAAATSTRHLIRQFLPQFLRFGHYCNKSPLIEISKQSGCCFLLRNFWFTNLNKTINGCVYFPYLLPRYTKNTFCDK